MPLDSMPAGGLFAGKTMRHWRWQAAAGDTTSAPLACRREQWYLLRAIGDERMNGSAAVFAEQIVDEQIVASHRIPLAAFADGQRAAQRVGWLKTGDDVGQIRLRLDPEAPAFRRLELRPVAERDPKCHPLANTPRWSTMPPALPLRRIVAPAALESLAEFFPGCRFEGLEGTRSKAALRGRLEGAVAVLDRACVERLGLSADQLLRMSAGAHVMIALDVAADLFCAAGVDTKVETYASPHEIMSARVDYSDSATRGFALQDVFPYGVLDGDDQFAVRVLRATPSWKRVADASGFATLLASETCWEKKTGDVLLASQPIAGGEFSVTDLPWLAAGALGPALAPRLAAHALRMLAGADIDDDLQYWNRWDEAAVVVRDISEMPRRYPVVRTMRWAPVGDVARLGLAVAPASDGPAQREMMICTGRADAVERHDGLPPEPMQIFLKRIARDALQGSAFARGSLRDTTVIWQFDSADGLKHATAYESAATLPPARERRVLRIVAGERDDFSGSEWTLRLDEGVFGDGAFDIETRLYPALRRWIATR